MDPLSPAEGEIAPEAALLTTRFLTIYAFSLLLTITTTPIALIEGMTLLLKPLRWLRLPVDDFALMTLIALRFIPTLIDKQSNW